MLSGLIEKASFCARSRAEWFDPERDDPSDFGSMERSYIAACSPSLIIALAEVAKAADKVSVLLPLSDYSSVRAFDDALSRLRALCEEP